MPPKKSITLTEAELRLMKILWARGESAVGELVAAMPDGAALAYNSVLTTIRILEQKGYVRHRQEGRAFLYIPCVAEQEASRSEVRHMMQRFFGNSRERLLLSLLGDDEVTPEELQRLKEAIAAAADDRVGGGRPMTVIDPMMGMGFLHSVESVSRLVANSFVSGLWQGIVLAACVGLCLRLMPKTTAAVRFAIWTAVFAVLAVLPLLHAYSLNSNGMPGRGAVMHVDVRWSFAIAAIWLIASLVRAVQLAMSAVRLHGIWKRAVPVEGCDAILSAAGIRGVELCTSCDVDRPSVIGFFSPRILIPEELFARLTTAEFGQIVLHEVGHLRRADDWINLLQKLSLVLVPLNPVLIWIERRLCLERELACDDDVLRFTKAPKAYATCLTNLAEQRLARKTAALSLGAWEERSELAKRVHSILRGGAGMGRTQSQVVMGALVLGLLGGSAELARCPQLVSFTRTALPASVAAQSLPATAGYQPVAFHPSDNAFGAAHETLLKASMPVNRETRETGLMDAPKRPTVPVKKAATKRHSAPPVLQSRIAMPQMRRAEHWVVLTSWEEQERPRMVFAVTEGPEERVISTSYAAVRVAGGWLVIQL